MTAPRRVLASAVRPPSRAIHLTAAYTIPLRPVHWLWTDRIAVGTLCLLGGREGIGKSLLAYTLAADITQGRLPGIYAGIPKAVLVVATEDSWEHTIAPRLTAADADLTLVYRVQVTTVTGTDAVVTLPIDLAELSRALEQTDAGLLILDPLLSRLASTLDSHKDSEVRQALEPLVHFAERARIAVLGLIHVNKSQSADPLSLLMGSRAFAAVARAVLFLLTDPDNPQQRLLGQAKNNLGRMDLPTLVFTVAGVRVATTVDGDVWTGKLSWQASTMRSLYDVIAATSTTAADQSAKTEAVNWLGDYLSTDSDHDSAKVKAAAHQAGHSERALRGARDFLRVKVTLYGFPRRTLWTLPAELLS